MAAGPLTDEQLEAAAAHEMFDFEPQRTPNKTAQADGWTPDLNPTQRLMFDDPRPFILAYGEKGSGKSMGIEHKLVRHCYEEYDALAVIFTPSIRTGKFGVMYDLESLVLPSWTDGIGLDWLPSKLDPNTKDRVMKVGNVHDGWSTVLQISIPYEEAIAARIKGVHPSFVMGDELTDCYGRGYFTKISAQMNRRRHIRGPQQYCGTCNPEGPSHWVYQVFIEEPVNKDTGETDPNFAVYHVPFSENAHRPEMAKYLETLERAVRNDPVERARLIDGKWVERPTGEALFRKHFMQDRHVVGNERDGTGLSPLKSLPCMVGYDIGQVYSAAVFLQMVPVSGMAMWIVFDEIVHLREKILYKQMAAEVVERILAWNEHCGAKMAWEHVTDDSAVNQWRPGGSGSLDAWEFEREFNRASRVHGIPTMKIRGCPKGAGSVGTRIRIMQGLLANDAIMISAQCRSVIDMLNMLESAKDDALKPKRTVAGHIHVHDALTYPLLYCEMRGTESFHTGPAVSGIIRVGVSA